MDDAFRANGCSSYEASHYILILFFLKRMSDISKHQNPPFSVPQEARWLNILLSKDTYSLLILKSLEIIEKNNPLLSGISDAYDQVGNLRIDDDFLNSMIMFVSPLTLLDEEFEEPDTVGSVIQEYIEKVNPYELSTPVPLAELVVSLTNIRDGMSVADPMAGTGNLLVEAFKCAPLSEDTPLSITLKGMDYHRSAVFFLKMNLFFNNIYNVDIDSHDSLRSPFITPDGRLEQFDRVFVHVPTGMKELSNFVQEPDPYNRFVYGTSPKSRMDFMLIQNAVAMTKPDGITAVIAGQGILFRGASEGEIRQRMVDDDIIEAIITLPSGVLSHSTISPVIMIFNKSKISDHKGKILFVDGSRLKYDRKGGLTNNIIKEILDVYTSYASISGFSNVAPVGAIKSNEYKLTVSLYIEDSLSTEAVNVREEIMELQNLQIQREKIMQSLFDQYRDLGYLNKN